MCGLIGILSHRDSADRFEAALRSAASSIAHRGPERTALHVAGRLACAHTLLSFHDHKSATQPFMSSCGRITLVWNGEIYNYADLAARLQQRGVPLQDGSEAALISALYLTHGEDCFTHLRGMFAIALHDGAKDRLVLARDFIGEKPLYYANTGDGIVFGSELTALRPFLAERRLNWRAFAGYFLFNAVDARDCLLAGVRKVSPGERVVLDRGGIHRASYWFPRIDAGTAAAGSTADHIAEIRRLLSTAVRRRLTADGVPMGVMLSGGVDSGLVAALARENGAALPCYSARFEGQSFDESGRAAQVAAHLSLTHDIVDLDDAVLAKTAETYLPKADEPVADPSFLGVAAVTRSASRDVKALLTGDGADDIFLGYSFLRAAGLFRLLSRAGLDRLLGRLGAAAERLGGSDRNLSWAYVLSLLARGVSAPPEWQHAYCTSALSPAELSGLLAPGFRHAPVPPDLAPMEFGSCWQRRVQAGMIRTFLQAPILTKLDRGSMLNGVELRCPFLDQDVVDASLRLPGRLLYDRGRTKVIVKAIARSYLPSQIVDRRKQGFRLPTRRLLRGKLRPLLTDALSADVLARQGLFDPVAVGRLVREHMTGGIDRSKPLWALLCFQLWIDRVGPVSP